MDESFTLTLTQAQKLEFALRRNGWTKEDLLKLLEGPMPKKVLDFVRRNGECPVPRGMRLVSIHDAERLEALDRTPEPEPSPERPDPEALARLADVSLESIFTLRVTKRFSSSSNVRTRFLNQMKRAHVFRSAGSGEYEEREIRTIGELVGTFSTADLLRQPDLGRSTVNFVTRVLASVGLSLRPR